ncbi:MAG: iron-containing alcohol dehydrogenase [Caldilineaceae bacterium]|nr:iron-containing alcohol dehydrogenase [Caldilineaceae bacterium]
MWFFNCPYIVHGEDALQYLEELEGRRAFIVTDPTLHKLGFTERIADHLIKAGMETLAFPEVEPEPSLQTVRRGVELMRSFEPDWIVGLGGGSAMDAAKAIWALYERPDIEPEEISPIYHLHLSKVKMIAIPTTSGTGAEATWMLMLTDVEEKRKLGLGNRELTPTMAIVDPCLTKQLPPSITADTGIDVLTHAIEGYAATYRNDYTDGLCLTAAKLVFEFLPRAVADGLNDDEARAKMANAATIAGLGFVNSWPALAHSMGHSFGAYFKVPHGRTVGLFLPYTMEFTLAGGLGRYADIARFIGFTDSRDETEAGGILIDRIRDLERSIGLPTRVADMSISRDSYSAAMSPCVENAEIDNAFFASPRVPDTEELHQLFMYAYDGKSVDF